MHFKFSIQNVKRIFICIIFNNFILLSCKPLYFYIFSYFDNNNYNSLILSLLLLFVHSSSKCIYSNYLESVRRMWCPSERDRSVSTFLPKKKWQMPLWALSPTSEWVFWCLCCYDVMNRLNGNNGANSLSLEKGCHSVVLDCTRRMWQSSSVKSGNREVQREVETLSNFTALHPAPLPPCGQWAAVAAGFSRAFYNFFI